MSKTTKVASLSLLMAAPALMLSGCIVREHTVEPAPPPQPVAVAVPEPTEGYYDATNHRWYHQHVWVVCEDRDPHCPP